MCAAEGYYEECTLGDRDCCFIEIREQRSELKQLCTGCKSRDACQSNKNENFVGIAPVHQCRPDYRSQTHGKRGPNTSVCRQCFNTCLPDIDPKFCFGSMVYNEPNAANEGTEIMVNLKTYQALSYEGEDLVAFGIPTWGVIDNALDFGVYDAIDSLSDYTLNVYHAGPVDGKLKPGLSNGDFVRDPAIEMTYWAVQGASAGWWYSDLKTIQDDLLDAGRDDQNAITEALFKGDWQT